MPVELREGKIIEDRYEILGPIGGGGGGSIWYGFDNKLKREIAIKLLNRTNASFLLSRSNEEEVLQEAQKVAALKHPNIVALYDIPLVEGDRLIIMEYLEGGSLEDRLKKLCLQGKWISQPEAFRILKDILQGLQVAHSSPQGPIIHRDLKPANILFDNSGMAKIADFGIASIGVIERLATRDQPGYFPEGTLCYMSPEQLKFGKIDQRSDLFNVGIISYLLLASAHPFVDHRFLFEYKEMVLKPYIKLPAIRHMISHPYRGLEGPNEEHLPADIEDFVNCLLALDPADRYQDVGEALSELEVIESRYQSNLLDRVLKLYDFLKTGNGEPISLSANELALGISLCKKSGFYRQGAYLYDKAGVDFSGLQNGAEEHLKSDYRLCLRKAGQEVEVI